MGKLEGKIALITGGNSGIGLATAKQFVSEGAYIFIAGRRDPELAVAVKQMGNNVTAVRGDVSNLGDSAISMRMPLRLHSATGVRQEGVRRACL